MAISFEKVVASPVQIEALFQLLNSRRHTISHRSLPDFSEHEQFVRKHPYRAWYLIKSNDQPIGSAYLGKDNVIGVNMDDSLISMHLQAIIKKVTDQFEPLPAIKSVRASHFSINVATSNKLFIAALDEQGFEAMQISYKIDGL